MSTGKSTEKLTSVIPVGERPMEKRAENVMKSEHIVISKEPHMLIIHASNVTEDQVVLIAKLAGAVKDEK